MSDLLFKYSMTGAQVSALLKHAKVLYVNSIRLHVSSSGIECAAVDPSLSAMGIMKLSPSVLRSFEPKRETVVYVDRSQLETLTKLDQADDVKFEYHEDSDFVRARAGNVTRRLAILTPDNEDPNEPNVVYNAKFITEGAEFKKVLPAMKTVSDTIRITSNGDNINYVCGTHNNVIEMVHTAEECALHGGEINSLFSLSYFVNMLDQCEPEDIVTMQMGINSPFKMSYSNAKGSFAYIVAPRIEGDD